MRLQSHLGGIFVKFLAIILIIAGLLLSLNSLYVSQQTAEPPELYWIVSWIIFITGLVLFLTGVMVQRRSLRHLKSKIARRKIVQSSSSR